MSVYDKELIIDGKAVRSPEQQVYKNMKDIEELQKVVKKAYKTSETLTSSSTSIAISDTNAPDGTKEGWLMTEDGLLFNITGGDDTTLLLSYYADLKGPQGEDGAAVNIDDTGTSLTKVWSSKKTSDEIEGLIDDTANTQKEDKTWSIKHIDERLSNAIGWTTSDLSGGNISLDNVYFSNEAASSQGVGDPKIKVKDLIAHKDGNGKIDGIYYVTAISSGTASVTKIGDIGAAASNYYSHNIYIRNGNVTDGDLTVQIINKSSNAFTLATLKTYLATKGFNNSDKFLQASGVCGSNYDPVIGLGVENIGGVTYLNIRYWNGAGKYISEPSVFNDVVVFIV